MSFKDSLDTDLAIFFNTDEFADEVVYISVTGGTIVMNTVVEYLDDLYSSPQGNYRKAILFVKKDDVNSIYMDRVWINTVEWKIIKIESEDNQVVKIHIQRDERIAL